MHSDSSKDLDLVGGQCYQTSDDPRCSWRGKHNCTLIILLHRRLGHGAVDNSVADWQEWNIQSSP